MKKRVLVYVVLAVMLLSGTVAAAPGVPAVLSNTKVFVNGQQVNSQAYTVAQQTVLSVSALADAMNYSVRYEQGVDSLYLLPRDPNTVAGYTGDIYGPQFTGLRYHGTANLTYDNGIKYNGDIRNGKFNGNGKITYPDGSTYTGNFVYGVIQGHGTFKFANGDTYTGFFVNNKPHGTGTYTYTNGTRVVADNDTDGRFSEGKITGGTVKIRKVNQKERKDLWWEPLQQVDTFASTWNPSLFNGKVDYIYADGTTFEGDIKNGKFTGKGEVVYIDGTKYTGAFLDNLKSGKGKIVYSDGNYYDGYWANDQYNGQGKYYNAINGRVLEGIWYNGKRTP